MRNYKEHLIHTKCTIKQGLIQLQELAQDAILFVVDDNEILIGSLTDGDVRRGLINGVGVDDCVNLVIQKDPKRIEKDNNDLEQIIAYRELNYRILPVVDENKKILNVINFRLIRSYLPVDAVIMAGGKGSRLMPLTENTPKPLLKVGEKPIMELNIDRLSLFGIDDYWLSVSYLGEQIEAYFGNGNQKNININYVWEDEPLGTIGAVSKIENFKHDTVLLTNSDILTNLDYEHFFLDFKKQDADLAVVTIPYQVNIPYAVLETENKKVLKFKEKPNYTYYSNGGIYLIKKEVLDLLPKNVFFNATDLMQKLLDQDKKVVSYPLSGYWLDVGKHEDYEKAQKDIEQIKF